MITKTCPKCKRYVFYAGRERFPLMCSCRAYDEVRELREALKECIAMLKIYYIPNSDGSCPTIEMAEKLL